MELYAFNASYVERLRAGDFRTQEHFASYFGELVKMKARFRVRTAADIEDIRQDTFSRVLAALRTEGGLREPEKLGAFVNSTCNNVLLEYYRQVRREPLAEEEEGQPENPDPGPGVVDLLLSKETGKLVQRILNRLSPRDRRLIRSVYLQERDKDEICQEEGVNRGYLRTLLLRARESFKAEYQKEVQSGPAHGPGSNTRKADS